MPFWQSSLSWQIWGSGAAATLLFQWHCTWSLSSIRKAKNYFLLGEEISAIPVLWFFFPSLTSYNDCLALSLKLSFIWLLPDVNAKSLFCILVFIVVSLSADMNHHSSVGNDEVLLICPNIYEIFLPVHYLIVFKICPWNQISVHQLNSLRVKFLADQGKEINSCTDDHNPRKTSP